MKRLSVCALLLGCAGSQVSVQQTISSRASGGDVLGAYDAALAELCRPSNDLDVARLYVELWLQLGKPGAPADRFTTCTTPPPADVVHYVRGLSLASVSASPEAQEELAKAAKTRPHEPEVAYRQGLVALSAHDAVSAVAFFKHAATMAPGRVDIRIVWARALVAQNSYVAAADVLLGLLALHPSPAELERARRVLADLVTASTPPMDADESAILRSVLNTVESGAVTSADMQRLQSLLAHHEHPETLYAAGLVSLKLGDLTEGRRYMLRAAELSPWDAKSYRALATSLAVLAKNPEAFPYLREVYKRDPFDVEATRLLATVALQANDIAVAREAYQRLIALEPDEAEHYLWAARLARQVGDLPAARGAVDRGCALRKDDIPLLLERAAILAHVARHTEGMDHFAARKEATDAVKALLAVSPNHPAADALLEGL